MAVLTMFPTDDPDVLEMLHEANALRRARGLPQLGPWWRVHRRELYQPRHWRLLTRFWGHH